MAILPDPEMIDAVICDAGGVLLLPDLAAGREAMRALGCVPDEQDWVRAHYGTILELDAVEIPDRVALRKVFASALGVPDEHLDLAVEIIENLTVATPWVAVDQAAESLRRLAEAGYKLAVVSNASGRVAEELEVAGVCSLSDQALPRVEIIVDSHLVGIEKPNPSIFHIAVDALDVSPERAIFVGDTVKFDVDGAIAAHLHPVHLEPFGQCQGDHAHISCLGDLVKWLIPS
jgi:putative hydrolase of the HAD superfamily